VVSSATSAQPGIADPERPRRVEGLFGDNLSSSPDKAEIILFISVTEVTPEVGQNIGSIEMLERA